MKRDKNGAFVLVLFTVFALSQTPLTYLYSQDYIWTISLEDSTVYNEVIPASIKNNSLIILSKTSSTEIPIERISTLKKNGGSNTWKYAGYGGLFGAVVTALITVANFQESTGIDGKEPLGFSTNMVAVIFSGAIGGTIGALLGGFVGSASNADEFYDFTNIPIKGKLTQLDWIVKNKVKLSE